MVDGFAVRLRVAVGGGGGGGLQLSVNLAAADIWFMTLGFPMACT